VGLATPDGAGMLGGRPVKVGGPWWSRPSGPPWGRNAVRCLGAQRALWDGLQLSEGGGRGAHVVGLVRAVRILVLLRDVFVPIQKAILVGAPLCPWAVIRIGLNLGLGGTFHESILAYPLGKRRFVLGAGYGTSGTEYSGCADSRDRTASVVVRRPFWSRNESPGGGAGDEEGDGNDRTRYPRFDLAAGGGDPDRWGFWAAILLGGEVFLTYSRARKPSSTFPESDVQITQMLQKALHPQAVFVRCLDPW